MAMTNVCQKSVCIYQDYRNKGFMFAIKGVWDRVCNPINQFFNISKWKWPSTSSLKSFTWFWTGIHELLPIYFFIPSACPAHDVTNFIDFDWFRQSFWQLFDLKLLFFKLFITLELKEILRNGKWPSSWLCCSSKFGIKKTTFNLHFNDFI